MSHAHTPEYTAVHGTWTKHYYGYADITDVYDNAAPEGQKLVCECSGPSQTERAALIACAPELLDTLNEAQEVLDILSMELSELGNRMSSSSAATLAMGIRSLIHKATGR